MSFLSNLFIPYEICGLSMNAKLDKFALSSGTYSMPSLLNVFARSSFFIIKPSLLIKEID